MSVSIVSLEPSVLFGAGEPLKQLAYLKLRSSSREEVKLQVTLQMKGAEEQRQEYTLPGAGDYTVHLWVPDISEPTEMSVTAVDPSGPEQASAQWRGRWQPQRKWKVYIIKASHYDLGYDGRVDYMQREAAYFVDIAKRLCQDSTQLHEWHYYLEHMGFVRAYERERKEVQLRELVEQYLKTGRMTLLGNPSGPHWHWMDYEQIARSGYPARREMQDRFGLDVKTMAIIDNPSGSWSAYQAFAQSGFKYAIRFVQPFRGPGSMKALGYPRVFYLEGPNGKDKILCSIADTYHESLWFGQPGGQSMGYIETAGHEMSGFLRRVEQGEHYGDYPYDTWIMPSYYDWEPPHEDERVNAQWRQKWRYPEIHFSDAAEGLDHIETHYADVIPTLRGDTNNYSADYTSIDPRSQGMKRKAARLLPFAEGLRAIAAARTGAYYPAKQFDKLYIDLVEYDEHCWPTMLPGIDTNIFNTNVIKTKSASRFYEAIGKQARQAVKLLDGGSAASPAAHIQLTVWNSLAHKRSDLAVCTLEPQDWSRLAGANWVLLDETTAEVCPVQMTENGTISFAALDVPAYGYKRYTFAPAADAKPVSATAAPRKVRAFADGSRLILENDFYRLEADSSAGTVVSLADLRQNRELLDPAAPYSFNQLLRVVGADFSYSARSNEIDVQAVGSSVCRLGPAGDLSAELIFETRDERLGVSVNSKIVLYAAFDRIDVINDVERMDFLHTSVNDRYKENVFISFPFRVEAPEFHLEYAPGVVNPSKDALTSISDFVTINQWMSVSNREIGITFVPHEASTVHLGRIMYNQFSSDYKPECSHLYSYARSNRMSGLTTLSLQDYKARLSYSIRSHAGDWREGCAPEFGWSQASPLLVHVSDGSGSGATEQSWLSVDAPNVQVTVLKRSEKPGEGYVVRLVETGGAERTNVRVQVRFTEIDKAWYCDLVENDRTPAQLADAHTVEAVIGKFDMVTLRLEPKGTHAEGITDVQAEPTGDSTILLSWKPTGERPDSASASAGAAAGFNIYRSEDPQFVPTLHTLVAYTEAQRFEDTQLKPGTVYWYRIAPADRNNRQGALSEALSARTGLTNVTPPAMLEEADVFPMDWDRLTVYWRKSMEPDIAYYEVYRSAEPDFTIDTMTPAAIVEHDGLWYQLYTDTDVKPGECWHYRIHPVDYAGNRQPRSLCVSGTAPERKRLYEYRAVF